MSQNDVLKVLIANDKLLKQTMTRESTAIGSLFPGGILPVSSGGTGANLSATGGANQIVRQNSAGADFTVSVLADADIPNHAYTKHTYSGLTAGAVFRATSATAASFGQVDLADTDAVTGTLPAARGGTGVSNAGTISNASNTTITGGGTLALGGFTLTVPATGTTALIGTSNTFSVDQNFSQDITVSGGINVGSATGAAAGQISTSANVGFGAAVSSVVRCYAKGSGTSSAAYAFFAEDSGSVALFFVRNDGVVMLAKSGGQLSCFASGGAGKQTVSGSRGGNAALASLLTGLANYGLITDSSTA